MLVIVESAIIAYLMFKVGAPWWMYIPLVATALFDLIWAGYKAGEKNGKDI